MYIYIYIKKPIKKHEINVLKNGAKFTPSVPVMHVPR